MRLRLFETGETDAPKATELEQDHLPAIGDLMPLEFGHGAQTLYRVVDMPLPGRS